jgi:hypothetical protein
MEASRYSISIRDAVLTASGVKMTVSIGLASDASAFQRSSVTIFCMRLWPGSSERRFALSTTNAGYEACISIATALALPKIIKLLNSNLKKELAAAKKIRLLALRL